MIKLIIGEEYELFNASFIYDGFNEGYGHFCDRCGKPRERLHWFHIGNKDNPTNVAKYGAECIRKISINPIKPSRERETKRAIKMTRDPRK